MEFQHSVLTKCVFCGEYPVKERESRFAVEMQIMICRYGVEINRDCERNRSGNRNKKKKKEGVQNKIEIKLGRERVR